MTLKDISEDIKSINRTNKEKVQILIKSSLKSFNRIKEEPVIIYNKSRITPPSDKYEFVDDWSGKYSLFDNDKSLEHYGVIFRSCEAPYKFIFAFQGFGALLDILYDIEDENLNIPTKGIFKNSNKYIKVKTGLFGVNTDSKITILSYRQINTKTFYYLTSIEVYVDNMHHFIRDYKFDPALTSYEKSNYVF